MDLKRQNEKELGIVDHAKILGLTRSPVILSGTTISMNQMNLQKRGKKGLIIISLVTEEGCQMTLFAFIIRLLGQFLNTVHRFTTTLCRGIQAMTRRECKRGQCLLYATICRTVYA